MTKILYLSYDGLTDPLGQSQILPYARLLSEEFSITIISFEKRYRFVQNRKLLEEICTHSHIQWKPLYYHKVPPIFSTLYDLWKLRGRVESLYSINRYDVIHCRSYVTSLIGIYMKRKYGVKFIFDMRGFWADERVESGLWSLKNIFYKSVYKFFKRKEKEFVSLADHIVSLTDRAKIEIQSWVHVTAPITVIPTCVDLELFDPNKISETEKIILREQLNIGPKDFVLLYLGSWGSWYLTNEMLTYFSEVKKIKKSTKFLLITTDKVQLNNYEFKDDVIVHESPRASVPLFISIANASVFFIKPTYSKMASSATKMGEIMAMNIPVITNLGWGDVEKIKEATGGQITTIRLKDSISLKDINPVNTRGYCMEKLSLEVGAENYRNIYKMVVKKSMHDLPK